jgi:hypothetical protein
LVKGQVGIQFAKLSPHQWRQFRVLGGYAHVNNLGIFGEHRRFPGIYNVELTRAKLAIWLWQACRGISVPLLFYCLAN